MPPPVPSAFLYAIDENASAHAPARPGGRLDSQRSSGAVALTSSRCCRQSTARAAMRAAATASMSLNSLARTGRCCRRPVRTIRLRNSFRAHSRRAPSGATAASFKTRACPAPQESCPRVRSEPHCWPCGRMSHAAGSPRRRSMPAAARQAAAAAAQ